MKDIKIFRNRAVLNNDEGSIVMHVDDMKSYPSWMLTNDKMVDKILFRGNTKTFNPESIKIQKELFEKQLTLLGNPESILITYDKTSKNLL